MKITISCEDRFFEFFKRHDVIIDQYLKLYQKVYGFKPSVHVQNQIETESTNSIVKRCDQLRLKINNVK